MKPPEWSGTVVCIASGPSLTAEDCETARAAGHPVIVTNTTFQLCPWANVLYAYDTKWWARYHEEVKAAFAGRLVTSSQIATKYGVDSTWGQTWFKNYTNSGANAISLAMAGGASKVVLLGFDCGTAPDGKKHWHGDHPPELGNAASIAMWPKKFELLAKDVRAKGIEVLNCSRATALRCFPRAPLETAL